jgi:hypothetical protein
MGEHPEVTTGRRNILVRGLFMVFMGLVFHLSGTLLFFVAVIQFAFALIGDAPNARLASFGRSLGLYMQQNVEFLTFVTEDKPFPFSDWPS